MKITDLKLSHPNWIIDHSWNLCELNVSGLKDIDIINVWISANEDDSFLYYLSFKDESKDIDFQKKLLLKSLHEIQFLVNNVEKYIAARI
ncbi:hypothetical protein B5C26_13335 [Photorhabdus luminescens]|uniref:hypothetical protein n=1 Tax=Photorhabdus luminescens TaxID=29488 RepID=UPI000B4CD093|nr:hypothetical protein [Photorhabdus luminescens]OWO81615.1 hypothetical protein B5C26_13335 [Photorhabdus luminescens]